jgi:outer membrane receptor protein involved in Fe transport
MSNIEAVTMAASPGFNRFSLCFLAGLLMIPVAGAQTTDEGYELTLEEVLVTATKREMSLQDVPLSVAALTGDTIEELSIRNLEDLSVYVPNFSKGETGIGPVINIRGIASGANQGFEQSVVMYVDDIPLSRAPLSRMPIFDLERIEVLRGPQNVLFGKNSVGGALSFITARPTEEVSGRLSLSYGYEYDDYEAIGVFSGPISDSVNTRVAVRGAQYGGYYENRLNGRDEEDREEKTVRATFDIGNSDDLSLLFKVEHSSVKGLGLGEEVVAGYRNPLPQSLLNPFGGMNFAEAAAFLSFLTQQDIGSTQVSQDRVRDTNPDEFYDLTMDTVHLIAEWEFDAFTLTSVTGWLGYEEERLYDGDLTGVDVLSQNFDEEFDQFSQELRLTSKSDGAVDWMAGAYFQTWNLEGDEVWVIDDQNLLSALGALSPALGYFSVMANSTSDKRYENSSDTWAVFGQVAWNISDAFRMTFGGRYTKETKKSFRFLDIYDTVTGDFNIVQAITGSCLFNTDYYTLGLYSEQVWLPGCAPGEFVPPGGYPIHAINGKISEDQFTPSAILEWAATDDNLFYARADKGFKAGGFDAKGARVKDFLYDPEEVWAYELGAKNTLADGAAEFNLAFFYMDYKDLQTSSFDGQAAFIVTNAAAATIKGMELESRWRATDGLTFFASAGYLDAKYDDYQGASCNAWESLLTGQTICDRSGRRFSYVPEWSATVGMDWVMPAFKGFDFRTSLDASYESDYYSDSTAEESIKQDAYTMLNLRLALESEQWVFSLLGKNLTDEEVFEFGTTVPNSAVYFGAPAYAAFLKPPRTIAVQAEYRF